MPNGYDPALLARRTAPPAAWPEKVTLIHPGVLYGDRRVDELLEALARPALAGRVRLELVGNLTAETERALEQAPPGVEVGIVPPQSWDATMDRVSAADAVAVIYPRSMGDELSLPVKLHEALALGKPVLSITAGGASEALLRELGQDHALARDGDAASVGDALERLLAGPRPRRWTRSGSPASTARAWRRTTRRSSTSWWEADARAPAARDPVLRARLCVRRLGDRRRDHRPGRARGRPRGDGGDHRRARRAPADPAGAPAEPAGAEVVRFRNVSHRLAAGVNGYLPRGYRRWLRRNIGRFDVVLLHDVYSVVSVGAARAAKRAGVPYALQPLGTLSPAAERGRPLAKRAFLELFADRTLRDATALIHSTAAERQDFLDVGAQARSSCGCRCRSSCRGSPGSRRRTARRSPTWGGCTRSRASTS